MNLVQHIIEDAQRRLAVLRLDASIRDIAGILANPITPLVVVCDSEGVALGVVSSMDIVNALSRDSSEAVNANAAALMTQPIRSCDAGPDTAIHMGSDGRGMRAMHSGARQGGKAAGRRSRARCGTRAPR